MSTNILPQPTTKNQTTESKQTTRRGFLRLCALLSIGTALAGLSDPVEEIPTAPPAWPDTARTQEIDLWISKLDNTIIKLEKLWSALRAARATSPGDVDIAVFLDLQDASREALATLIADFENEQFDQLLTALTGRSAIACLLEQHARRGELNIQQLEDELAGYPHAISEAEARRLRGLVS